MAQYDFDRMVQRMNTNASKWQVEKDVLPMWVADMDFETSPAVKQRLIDRASHGIYGYVDIPDAYYEAEKSWWHKRHGYEIKREWIEFCTGVIPSLSSVVNALTIPGDKVLIQTPVYNYFNSSIANNGCEIIENPLILDEGRYVMDYEDLADKAARDDVKMIILCNPHNPVGRAWSKAELKRLGDICLGNNILVVSDEIHRDLTYSNTTYTPFLAVDPDFAMNSITCTAPSKVFNLAGLKTANMIIPDPDLKRKVNRSSNDKEVAEPNAFGIEGLMAAYTEGGPWVDALQLYIEANIDYALDFIRKHIPEVETIRPEATYLLWLDFRRFEMTSNDIQESQKNEVGLWLSAGSQFGLQGEGFMRMNLACPRQRLEVGLERLKSWVNQQSMDHQ